MTDASGYTVELGGQTFTKEQWEVMTVWKNGTVSPTVEIVGPDAPPKSWHGPTEATFTGLPYHDCTRTHEAPACSLHRSEHELHWDKGDTPFEFQNSEPGTEIGLKEALFQAMGYVSGCWDRMSGAGVFHSTSAVSAGEMVMKVIERHIDRAYKAGEAMHRTTVVNVVQPTMDDAKARTLLHQYSEWLDTEHTLTEESGRLDARTHDDLVAHFLSGRDPRALPVVE